MSGLPLNVELLALDWAAPPYQFYDSDLRVLLLALNDESRFDWSDARASALALGGDLAVLGSASEQDYVKDTLNRAVERDSNYLQNYYIGLYRSSQEQAWVWVDGQYLNSQVVDWAANQPENSSGLSEHAVLWASVFEGAPIELDERFRWDDQGSFHENRAETRAALVEIPLRRNGSSGYALIPVASSSWSEARQLAQSLGGDLATIDGFGEREYVRTLIPEGQAAWIGLTTSTSASGSNWQWLTEQSSYTHVNWDSEEGWTASAPTADTVASLSQAEGNFASWPDQPQEEIRWALIEFQLIDAAVSAAAAPADFGAYIQELLWPNASIPVEVGTPITVEMVLSRALTLNQSVPDVSTPVPIILSYSIQDPAGTTSTQVSQSGELLEGGSRVAFNLYPGVSDPYVARDVTIELRSLRLDTDGINPQIGDYYDGTQAGLVAVKGSIDRGFYGFDLDLSPSLSLIRDVSLLPATAPASARIVSVLPLDAAQSQYESGAHLDLVVEFDKKLIDSRLYYPELTPSVLSLEVDGVLREARYHVPLTTVNDQSPYQLKHIYRLASEGIQYDELKQISVARFQDPASTLYGTNESNLYYYASDQLTDLQDPVIRLDQPGFGSGWSMDIDGDGQISALSDGLLVASYVNGVSLDTLPDAIIGSALGRSVEDMRRYFDAAAAAGAFDIDADGSSPTPTDLALVTRYAFGTFPGDSLLRELPGPNPLSADLATVTNVLQSLF